MQLKMPNMAAAENDIFAVENRGPCMCTLTNYVVGFRPTLYALTSHWSKQVIFNFPFTILRIGENAISVNAETT